MNSLFSIFDMQKNFSSSSNEMSCTNLRNKLFYFLDVFDKYSKEFIKVMGETYNQPAWDIYYNEIRLIKKEIKYFIKNIKKFRKSKILFDSFKDAILLQAKSYRQPYGSCLFLFNEILPVSKIFSLLIGSLSCGNTLFVKLPSFSIEINKVIKSIFKEVFNDNYIYFISESIPENDLKNIYDFNFDLVFFSGNSSTSKTILRIFAPRFTKVILDISNKNPVILDETADLAKAAKQLIWSKMLCSGQTFQSPDFLIIHESIIESFVKHIKSEYENQFGKGENWNNITKIDSIENFNNIVSTLNKSLSKNRIIFGGDVENDLRKIQLTLIQVDDLKSPLLSQDMKSPILPVVIFNSFSDINGIVRHNDCPSCIYFFSKNKKRIKNLLKSLESRFFSINNINIPYFKGLPHGGIKNSGNSIFSCRQSIKIFSYKRIVLKDSISFSSKYASTVEKNSKIRSKIDKL